MPRSRPVGGKGDKQKCTKKTEVSIRWRGVVGSGWKRINRESFSCI